MGGDCERERVGVVVKNREGLVVDGDGRVWSGAFDLK